MTRDLETLADKKAIVRRAEEIFQGDLKKIVAHWDGLFAWLLIVQWLTTIFATLAATPLSQVRGGAPTTSVWIAVFLGAIIVAIPVGLGLIRPGHPSTRHTVAMGQMLLGSMLIHLTGGQFETHFHVFVSLALLSFYRDWRVLASASAIVLLDHCIRGLFRPLSIYGLVEAGPWRWLQHIGWLGLIDVFLMRSCILWVREMRGVALRQSELEAAREHISATASFAEALNQGESSATYQSALSSIRGVMGLPFAAIFAATSEGTLEPRAAAGVDDGPLDSKLLRSDGLPAKVFRTCEPETLLGPFGHGSMRIRFGLGDLGLLAVRGWPIIFRKKCLGVVITAHLGPLSEPQRAFLAAALDQLAVRMNAFLVDEHRVKLLADLQRQSIQLQEATRNAERASRVKSEFLANMSHELRTPMNSIMGFTQRLIRRLGDQLPERDADALRTVDRNAKHLLGLINNILDLSKIEAGKMEVKHARFDLAALVRDVLEQTAPLADGKPIAINADLPEQPLPDIHADPVMTRQILTNLVSNAIKYTEQGGVRVSLAMVDEPGMGSAMRISVRDTGIGIRPEDRPKLFQKFMQLDGGATRKAGGTGLGLVICEQYVKLQGGRIDVESESGKGSVFTVYLPIEPIAGERIAVAPPQPRPNGRIEFEPSPPPPPPAVILPHRLFDGPGSFGGLSEIDANGAGGEGDPPITILCVDDEPDILKYFQLTFEDAGFRVLLAGDHDSALEEARASKPDLVCLDLRMPGKDGFEVIKSLRSDPRLSDVPIVVISVDSEEVRVLDAGARCYLAKPVDAEGLVSTVRDILAGDSGSVLIVEDNPDTARLVGDSLVDQGFHVRWACDGRQGLRELAKATPAVIILDLMMPVMDGLAFLRHIRDDRRYREVPVIVWTAKPLDSREFRELSRVASTILAKGRDDAQRVIEEVLKKIPREDHVRAPELMEAGL